MRYLFNFFLISGGGDPKFFYADVLAEGPPTRVAEPAIGELLSQDQPRPGQFKGSWEDLFRVAYRLQFVEALSERVARAVETIQNLWER